MTTTSASEVRSQFAETLGRVAYGKERITIARRGRPLAALVPMEDLAALENGAQGLQPESDPLLRALMEGSPVEMAVKDTSGRYLIVSREFERLNKTTSDEIVGKSPADIYPADTAEVIRHQDEEVLRTGKTIQWEVDAPVDGAMRTYLAAKFPVRDDDGRITSIGGVATDITERKRVEEALRESEERFRSLYNSIPLSVWEEDWSGVKKMLDRLSEQGISDWQAYFETHDEEVKRAYDLCRSLNLNSTTLEMYRAPTKEAALRLVSSGKLTVEETRTFANWLATFATGHPTFIAESEETRDDGTAFAARIRSYVPPEYVDTWARVVTTVEDITERKHAEEALSESDALLHQAAEMANLGYWVWDEVDDRCLYCSETLAQLSGLTVDEYYEHYKISSDFLPDVHPEDRKRYEQEIEAAVRERRTYDIEFRDVSPNGRSRYLRERGEPVLDNDGRLVRTVGTLQDVTDYKRAELALEEARDELELRVAERTQELHTTNRALEEEVAERGRIEARLRESEHDLLNLIEGSIQGVLIVTETRKPLFANRACAEIFGFQSPEEFLQLGSTVPLIAPYEIQRLDDIRARHFKKEEMPISYEFDGLRKDGAIIRLQCMARTMDWKGERVAQVTLLDITESKRAEEALRESEERLRQATELAGLGHWVWDVVEDKYIYCSERNAHIHGVTVADYVELTADLEDDLGFIHPEDREEARAAYAGLRQGKGFDKEFRIVTPAGHVRWVREIAEPVFGSTGTVIREHGTVQDISERRQAEETIRTREAWLSAILDGSPDEIVLKDRDGRILLANKRSVDGFGVTLGSVRGKRTSDFLPPEIAQIYQDADRRVLKSGEPNLQEVTETIDGQTKHYLSSKFPLRDKSGAITGVCSITTDITRMTEMQEQLHQAQKMKAVGQLTGGVAHDFNNLLAIILGNAEILAERLGPDDRCADAVLRAAQRGAELTERLLAFSRRQPLRPQPVNLGSLVSGMSEMLARTLGRSIQVSVSSSAKLWPALADPGQVENALLNLAINARDAMPDGGLLSVATQNVTIDETAAAKQTDAKPGDYAVLSVTDTGTGIPAEVLEHVFEPFFTTREVGQGSGLGLSMVYGFAQQSDGFVAIESELGKGTTIRLHLPRATDSAQRHTLEPPQVPPRGDGERVLLLEDTADVRELAAVMLEDLGYEVLTAADAASAGARLAADPNVDLLLTDVVLPGGQSGPTFAREAKQKHSGLKVLFMSGHPAEKLGKGARLDPNIDLLIKPFRKLTLAQRVREVLDRDQSVI